MDLGQAVETTKRVLMKEKIDRQLVGQNSLTPFMNIRDNLNKRVPFDMTDDIVGIFQWKSDWNYRKIF